jgi:hypothetical protein
MRIIATDDGFVGIFEKSTINAIRILNIIFATGISFGIGSEFVREKDGYGKSFFQHILGDPNISNPHTR